MCCALINTTIIHYYKIKIAREEVCYSTYAHMSGNNFTKRKQVVLDCHKSIRNSPTVTLCRCEARSVVLVSLHFRWVIPSCHIIQEMLRSIVSHLCHCTTFCIFVNMHGLCLWSFVGVNVIEIICVNKLVK